MGNHGEALLSATIAGLGVLLQPAELVVEALEAGTPGGALASVHNPSTPAVSDLRTGQADDTGTAELCRLCSQKLRGGVRINVDFTVKAGSDLQAARGACSLRPPFQ